MPLTRRHLMMALALPGAADAATLAPLRVVSSDLPPYAIVGRPARPGLAVEMVEEVMRRCGQPLQVEFYPWARTLQMALRDPHTAVAPILRTPERERKFQWLLMLCQERFMLLGRQDQTAIDELAAARKLRVAVLRASPLRDHLLTLGFSPARVFEGSAHEDLLRLLERDHVDATFSAERVLLEKIRISGRDVSRYRLGLELMRGSAWLASGAGYADVERLRAAHLSMYRDGSIERLYRAYGIKLREGELQSIFGNPPTNTASPPERQAQP